MNKVFISVLYPNTNKFWKQISAIQSPSMNYEEARKKYS